MEFEGRVLSDKKALEAVLARCIPVVTDNHYQVTENPRNKDLFEQTERWRLYSGGPGPKTYVGINYPNADRRELPENSTPPASRWMRRPS